MKTQDIGEKTPSPACASGRRIVFPRPHHVELESFDIPAPGEGQVRAKAICSLISTGTEGIVFNHLFEPGTAWERWARYPFHPGYAWIGEIEAMGDGVAERTALKVGDRVAARASHASHHVLPAKQFRPVPDGIEAEAASWFALAKIAAMGVRVADFRLGGCVVIVGAGPVGQMLCRWAAASGLASIVMVDPVASRLQTAMRGGATAGVTARIDQAGDGIRQALGGKEPPLLVDTTGHPAVFGALLDLAAPRGRVVILGDTGTPSEQRLTGSLLRKGLTVTAAHDIHEDDQWNSDLLVPLFFQLVRNGRFDVTGMVSHRFSPDQCAHAYATLTDRREQTMGMVFNW